MKTAREIKLGFSVGSRIHIRPESEWGARGARLATVVKIGRKWVHAETLGGSVIKLRPSEIQERAP